MATLNVTRSLVRNTNPTEAQFDEMRDDLLDFFNNQLLNEDNIGEGGLLYSTLNNSIADNALFSWEGDDALVKYSTADDKFVIQNTEGDIVFGHKSGSTVTSYMRLDKDTGLLTLKGLPEFNTSVGSQAVDLMWLLSSYRKPRLNYSDSNIVTLLPNYSDGNTYIMGRDRLWKVFDTTCSLSVNANGETSGDTGTAVSGLGVGLTRAVNTWYYIYAVEVQYGTQADGINCILVANVTPPISSNISTLNTAFGTGKWLYMGVIRNGYNDGTNTNIILPFRTEENGFVMFTNGTIDHEGRGMYLARATTGTSNLSYTIDVTNNDADSIPPVATRMIVSGYRSELGFEFEYVEIASSEVHARTSNGYHITGQFSLTATAILDVPVISGYQLTVIMGNTENNRSIQLVGFMDHYV